MILIISQLQWDQWKCWYCSYYSSMIPQHLHWWLTLNTIEHWPVARSHTLTVLSSLALASCRPSGLRATHSTELSCPYTDPSVTPSPQHVVFLKRNNGRSQSTQCMDTYLHDGSITWPSITMHSTQHHSCGEASLPFGGLHVLSTDRKGAHLIHCGGGLHVVRAGFKFCIISLHPPGWVGGGIHSLLHFTEIDNKQNMTYDHCSDVWMYGNWTCWC